MIKSQKSKKIPLYIKILIGMFAGILCGLIFIWFNLDFSLIRDWVEPFGNIFMRLLKLIAVPLVFVSLILGVGGLSDVSSLSKLGFRAIGLYVSTTILAILVGITLVLSIKPGSVVDESTKAHLSATYSEALGEHQVNAGVVEEQSPLHFLVDMVPENFINAAGDNSQMLQVICFALLIGVAVLMIGRDSKKPFMDFMTSFNSIILKVIDIIMKFAPIGVFALMCSMIVNNAGDASLFSALGLYAFTVIIGLMLLIVVIYPLLVKLFTNVPLPKFFKSIWPVQLLGFSTSSSAATLPLTLKQSEQALGISKKTANFVLPVGVTINMGGTSLYQAVAAIFIAQVFGVELSFVQILTIIATTTISSIGTPGVPGGSVVILLMVLSSAGIPAEGLALILGIDRPLDMLRTVANVTGDVTVAAIVDKNINSGELDSSKEELDEE